MQLEIILALSVVNASKLRRFLIKLTHGILGMRVAILKSTYAGAKQQAIIAAIQNVTSFATPAVASMSCCNLEGVKIIMQQMLSIIFEWVLIYMEIFYIV